MKKALTTLLFVATSLSVGGEVAYADPLCYFDRPDGTRVDLSAFCGRSSNTQTLTPSTPLQSQSQKKAIDYFRQLRSGMNRQAVEAVMGSPGILSSPGAWDWNFPPSGWIRVSFDSNDRVRAVSGGDELGRALTTDSQ